MLKENNDYIKLEQIIDSKKDIDVFLKRKSFETLLSKAVLCRSQQCFDLLCNMTIEEGDKDMFYTRAFYNAIEYYVMAPNSHNMYYIDMIMKRSIIIDYYAMYKSLRNNDLFIRFFNLFDKKAFDIKRLIIMAIINNAEINFDFLYTYGNANNIINIDLKNEIYSQVLHSTNINMLIFLINMGITWTTNYEIPSLYSVLNNNNMFCYLYNKYSELTKEELNSIPNIEEKFPHEFTINKQSLDNFKKMLSLPFDFDMSNIIATIFKFIYNYKIYTSNYGTQSMIHDIGIKYIVMELIFNSKKVKTNPLLKINYADFLLKYKNNITMLTNHQILLQQYKNIMMRFIDMCKKNNYILETFIL
jgi:hypothetical protein